MWDAGRRNGYVGGWAQEELEGPFSPSEIESLFCMLEEWAKGVGGTTIPCSVLNTYIPLFFLDFFQKTTDLKKAAWASKYP